MEDTQSKIVEHVSIFKSENGFILHLTHLRKIDTLPDTIMNGDDMTRWQLTQEIELQNHKPKTYVFSNFDDMCNFIKIQSGWS